MTVIDPNTGLMITCEPWEYAELCKSHGWIKTAYETNTAPLEEKIKLGKEDKAVADKAAKLIARDYGEVLKRLEEE